MAFSQNKYDRLMKKLYKNAPMEDFKLFVKPRDGATTIYDLKGNYSIAKPNLTSSGGALPQYFYVYDYVFTFDTEQLKDLEIEVPSGSGNKIKLLFLLEDINYYSVDGTWEFKIDATNRRQDIKLDYSYYTDGAYRGELALVSLKNQF